MAVLVILEIVHEKMMGYADKEKDSEDDGDHNNDGGGDDIDFDGAEVVVAVMMIMRGGRMAQSILPGSHGHQGLTTGTDTTYVTRCIERIHIDARCIGCQA